MKNAWRYFVAEFVGTFALVFIGGGSIITSSVLGQSALLGIALSQGFIYAVMVSATMRISGHLNPAVTAGYLVAGRIEAMRAAVHWIAQILGAVIAAYVLKALFPSAVAVATRLGGQSISSDVTLLQAIILEAIATFFLVFTFFATAVDPRGPKVGGFAIGLALAAGILGIGPLTGGSLNPARSFGPAIVTGILEGQTAYWVGPLLGGVLAGLLYEKLIMPHGEETPSPSVEV